jgi:hypothetical protein
MLVHEPSAYRRRMQQHNETTFPKVHSRTRSRLILPASIAEVRAALESRVAQSPLDIAARVSLGELNLSVSLAGNASGDREHGPAADLLRARHVVPDLAAMITPAGSRSRS